MDLAGDCRTPAVEVAEAGSRNLSTPVGYRAVDLADDGRTPTAEVAEAAEVGPRSSGCLGVGFHGTSYASHDLLEHLQEIGACWKTAGCFLEQIDPLLPIGHLAPLAGWTPVRFGPLPGWTPFRRRVAPRAGA